MSTETIITAVEFINRINNPSYSSSIANTKIIVEGNIELNSQNYFKNYLQINSFTFLGNLIIKDLELVISFKIHDCTFKNKLEFSSLHISLNNSSSIELLMCNISCLNIINCINIGEIIINKNLQIHNLNIRRCENINFVIISENQFDGSIIIRNCSFETLKIEHNNVVDLIDIFNIQTVDLIIQNNTINNKIQLLGFNKIDIIQIEDNYIKNERTEY